MTLEDVKNTDWESICEEDWYDVRRNNPKTPRLIFSDEFGNHYYFMKRVRGNDGKN